MHIARDADACAHAGDVACQVTGASAERDATIGSDGGAHGSGVVHPQHKATGRTRSGAEGASGRHIAHHSDIARALQQQLTTCGGR